MNFIILISSFLVLISCIVITIMQIKEKKRITPFTLLMVFTIITALFILLKMTDVL